MPRIRDAVCSRPVLYTATLLALSVTGVAWSRRGVTVAGSGVVRASLAEALPSDGFARAVGSPNAAHTLIVFSDYTCDGCRVLFAELSPHIRDSTVRVVWREAPSPRNAFSAQAAVVSGCARQMRYGDEYAAVLFANPSSSGPFLRDNTGPLATLSGAGEVRACTLSGLTARDLAEDKHAAQTLKISITPTLWLDGYRYNGHPKHMKKLLMQQ